MPDEIQEIEERQEVAIATTKPIFSDDPIQALAVAETVVKSVSKRCKGEKFICKIKGKDYPKVEWWTTVGASLGLFPYTVWSRPIVRDAVRCIYEARVEVRKNGQPVTAAEALCSSSEDNWKNDDEYAIRSMAITRATAKAYRIGLSFLAVLAGLEPTPAEEVPGGGFGDNKTKTKTKTKTNNYNLSKLTDLQRKKATRIHEYLIAECNGATPGAEKLLGAITKSMFNVSIKKFNDLLGVQIDKLWIRSKAKVEEFEKASKQNKEKSE